jgi:serine/threonine protein kinase
VTDRPSIAPESIDQYRVVRQIGSGGAADTYEVVWTGHDGTEGRGCLKMLHAHCARERRSREFFAREARIAGHLHHGNLVDIVDHKLDADRPYVVFQFIDGVDLRALRRDTGLTWGQVMWIGERVAAALSYAHSFREGEIHGVLHRDVAPGNILIDREGGVKLADFGLARVQSDVTGSLTLERELAGTVPYLAPEVVRGERATEHSDIYGLGAVLYELAVGTPPFEAANHYELIRKVGDGERSNPAPLAELAPDFPPDFHALVDSMLARDPDDRPTNAYDVQLRLQESGVGRAERRGLGRTVRAVQETLNKSAPLNTASIASGVPVSSRSTASSAKPTRWRRRALIGVAAAGLVATLIPSWRAWSSSRTEESSPPAAQSEESNPQFQSLAVAKDSTLAWSAPEEVGLVPPVSVAAVQDEGSEQLARGRVVIYAEPWGNVWLNGKQVGRSPFRERLKPGLYTVQVGDTYPEAPKRIRVSSGKTREVLIKREALQ